MKTFLIKTLDLLRHPLVLRAAILLVSVGYYQIMYSVPKLFAKNISADVAEILFFLLLAAPGILVMSLARSWPKSWYRWAAVIILGHITLFPMLVIVVGWAWCAWIDLKHLAQTSEGEPGVSSTSPSDSGSGSKPKAETAERVQPKRASRKDRKRSK